MKVNPSALLASSGFDCRRVSVDRSTGEATYLNARAAFVTEETMSALQAHLARHPSDADWKRFPEVRYGDILAMWSDAQGRRQAQRIEIGKDGGLYIEMSVDKEHVLHPITGGSMLIARERLLENARNGIALSPVQRSVLSGIQGVIEIITADPDPVRFSSEIIGMAFVASIIDSQGDVNLPVTFEEFGRKARAELIRAQIGLIDPLHRDAIAAAQPLGQILKHHLGEYVSTVIRSVSGIPIDESAMRRMVMASDSLTNEVFGIMTTTSVSRISATPLEVDKAERLQSRLAAHRLQGEWIDTARDRINSVTSQVQSSYSCSLDLYAVGGRDILIVRDPTSDQMGASYVYSWPTSERLSIGDLGNGRVINISPNEIPTEKEVNRLRAVLEELSMGPADDLRSLIGRMDEDAM